MVRTTNNQVYMVDGMNQHTHHKILSLAKSNGLYGRGHAIRQNPQSSKDLSALVGQHKKTVAVFYVLDAGTFAQDLFFDHQRAAARKAEDIGPISLQNVLGNPISFVKSINDGNSKWMPCTQDDITWTNNYSRLSWEFKVWQY
jgi:hypothetical protein